MSDGVLVDTDKRKVIRASGTREFRFGCAMNRYCLTEYGSVVAIVKHYGSKAKLI